MQISEAITITDADIEVDFLAPKDWKEEVAVTTRRESNFRPPSSKSVERESVIPPSLPEGTKPERKVKRKEELKKEILHYDIYDLHKFPGRGARLDGSPVPPPPPPHMTVPHKENANPKEETPKEIIPFIPFSGKGYKLI
jgi:hypothetical protein